MKKIIVKLFLSFSILAMSVCPAHTTSIEIVSSSKNAKNKKDKGNKSKSKNSIMHKIIKRETQKEKFMRKQQEIEDRYYKKRLIEESKYINMHVPAHSDFKSYMSYKMNVNLRAKANEAYTDENGLRKQGDYFMVAMGQYYGTVGDKFKVTLANGMEFKVVLGDVKKYEDTYNKQGYVGADNRDLFEFIVDTPRLNSKIRTDGSANCIFNGQVIKIEKERGT